MIENWGPYFSKSDIMFLGSNNFFSSGGSMTIINWTTKILWAVFDILFGQTKIQSPTFSWHSQQPKIDDWIFRPLPEKFEQRQFFKTWINDHFLLNDQIFLSSSQIFLGRPKIQSPPMMTKKTKKIWSSTSDDQRISIAQLSDKKSKKLVTNLVTIEFVFGCHR